MARAGLTAEEIADLLSPGSARPCERWVEPLVSARCEATSSARFGQNRRKAMGLLNAERIVNAVLRRVNAQDQEREQGRRQTRAGGTNPTSFGTKAAGFG